MDKLLLAAANITQHGKHYWEWANGEVIRIYVNAASGVMYPAPTAPAPPAVPAPIPPPTPWLPIIIALMAISIVAVILVWQHGYRRKR